MEKSRPACLALPLGFLQIRGGNEAACWEGSYIALLQLVAREGCCCIIYSRRNEVAWITKMAHTSDNPISASTMSGLTMMFTQAEELFAATVKMFPSYLLLLRLVPS